MTYKELAIGTKIKLKKKRERERGISEKTKAKIYTVKAKYPYMCIVEDHAGRKRGVPIGELIMNGIIMQGEAAEALRRERNKEKDVSGWHKGETS